MVNHDVQWLYISMHNTVRVGILQRLQYFIGVKSDVHVVEQVV